MKHIRNFIYVLSTKVTMEKSRLSISPKGRLSQSVKHVYTILSY
jgi:hypothetical protein